MTNKELKKWLVKAGLIITILSLIGGATSCTGTGPEVGKQAPDFTLGTMAGTEITLSELRGTPVVLTFWAIYCPACRSELGYFEYAAEQSGGEVAIIMVNTQDTLSGIEKFFGDYKVHFTVALGGGTQVSDKYNIQYIPTTFFIESGGIIRNIKIGAFASEMELWAAIEPIRGPTP
jgi:peroxiredoxin